MNKWIKCENYKELPVGEWLVRVNNDKYKHQIATVRENRPGQKIVIVGGYFYFDADDLIAYTDFEGCEYD